MIIKEAGLSESWDFQRDGIIREARLIFPSIEGRWDFLRGGDIRENTVVQFSTALGTAFLHCRPSQLKGPNTIQVIHVINSNITFVMFNRTFSRLLSTAQKLQVLFPCYTSFTILEVDIYENGVEGGWL